MNIALLGYGTVAKGTIKSLTSTGIKVSKILVRRNIEDIGNFSTFDMGEICEDPGISLVAELIGGDEPAFTYVMKALNAHKHVVTANKLMVSRHYPELLETARKNGVTIAFSAAAGGGIPWLVNLQRFAATDNILSVEGIMNGTTNYILDKMTSEATTFDDALKAAQALGYAEADPSADIDGLDIRSKLALSVNAASGSFIDPETIPVMGIRYISKEDIEFFRTKGLACKLLARAEFTGKGVAAAVEPVLLSQGSQLASIKGPGNMISVELENSGIMSFSGAGAGGGPTGNAVAMDICDVLAKTSVYRNLRCTGSVFADRSSMLRRYYIRDTEVKITDPMSPDSAAALVNEKLQQAIPCFAAAIIEK